MAVYTPVSSEELSEFLSGYSIGTLISHKGIEAGVSNTNYFIDTTSGRYVLTLYEPHRVHEDEILFFMNYAICLEENGVPCPKTILRKDRSFRGTLNGRPAAIFSLLVGEGASVATLTPAKCEAAGEVLARMHRAAQGYKARSPNHFGPKRWIDWLTAIGPEMNGIADGLYKFAAGEYDYVASHWPKNLPSGAIHADYFPDNVFFEGDDVTGVIDFHFVCTDLFAYDLAIAANAWSFDGNNDFQKDRLEALIRGYQSVRPLSHDEILSLSVLLRAAALRFLLSRVEEKLKWKPDDFMIPHDPMVFEKRLRHFQLSGYIIP